jgi:hypothetical protein
MARRPISWLVALAVVAGLPVVACVDESHELAVEAQGPEAPGVPRGPTHRPGQPCLVCHGGQGPASARFLMAGTVYGVQGESAPAGGAKVGIEDIRGSSFTATTNEAGNFFIRPEDWSLIYPAQVQVALGDETPQMMGTHINRDGSCADCHALTLGPTSPGPVFAALAPLGDGGP